MAAKAKYKIYDSASQQWVQYYLETSAAQVLMTEGRHFITANTQVNGIGFTLTTDTVGGVANTPVERLTLTGANIDGGAVAYSGTLSPTNTNNANALHYITASDKISVALGKLDKAAYDAAQSAVGYLPLSGGTITGDNAIYFGDSNHYIKRTDDGSQNYLLEIGAPELKIIGSWESAITVDWITGGGNHKTFEFIGDDDDHALWARFNTDVLFNGSGKLYYGAKSSSNELATKGDLSNAIDALPTPMQFKGTVGDGGTVTWANLPAAASSNNGQAYKAITAYTNTGSSDTKPTCQVGDMIISNGSAWVLIPSGDEPSGTVTSVGLSLPSIFSVSGSPVTSSGTLTATLATQSAHAVFAGPTSGSAATPTFRALVASDIPDLKSVYVPYTGATSSINLNGQTLGNVGSLYIGDPNVSNAIYSYMYNDESGLFLGTNSGNGNIYIEAAYFGGGIILDSKDNHYWITNNSGNNPVLENIASQEWTTSNFSRVTVSSGSAPSYTGLKTGDVWIDITE